MSLFLDFAMQQCLLCKEIIECAKSRIIVVSNAYARDLLFNGNTGDNAFKCSFDENIGTPRIPLDLMHRKQSNSFSIYFQIASFCQLLKNPILYIGILGLCSNKVSILFLILWSGYISLQRYSIAVIT